MVPNVLTTVFNATGNYTPAVIGMTRATTSLATSAQAANRSMGLLSVSSRGVALTGASFLRGSMGVLLLGTAFVTAGKEAMDFGQQMGNVATLVNTSVESMDDMGSNVLRLGKLIPKTTSDMTEALYQIRSAGIGAANAMETLKQSGILATAGLGTTTEAANMVTSAINVFKKENLNAATAADILFKTVAGGKTKVSLLSEEFGKSALAASDVGITFKELMAMTAAMTNTGVQTGEAQTAITQAMISLNKRTSEMIEIQGKLSGKLNITGMEFIQWAGSGVKAMEMIDKYATSHKLDLFKIYGRKEGALADIALTRLQNKTYNDLLGTMNGVNLVNEAYAKQMDEAAAKFQIFKNGVTQLAVRIGNVLLPPLNALLSVLNPMFDSISSFAKDHRFLTQLVLIGIVAKQMTGTFSVLTNTFGAFGNMMGVNTSKMWLFNTAFKRTFWIITAASLALAGFYRIKEEKEKRAKEEEKFNPFGFDFGRSISNKHDKELQKKLGMSDAAYDSAKKYYQFSIEKSAHDKFIKSMRADSTSDAEYNYLQQHPIDSNLNKGQHAFYDSIYKSKDYQEYQKNGVLPMPGVDTPKKSSFNYVPPSGGAKSRTDEILTKIYEVLKGQQQTPAPAYAANGRSAKPVIPSIYSTFKTS